MNSVPESYPRPVCTFKDIVGRAAGEITIFVYYSRPLRPTQGRALPYGLHRFLLRSRGGRRSFFIYPVHAVGPRFRMGRAELNSISQPIITGSSHGVISISYTNVSMQILSVNMNKCCQYRPNLRGLVDLTLILDFLLWVFSRN